MFFRTFREQIRIVSRILANFRGIAVFVAPRSSTCVRKEKVDPVDQHGVQSPVGKHDDKALANVMNQLQRGPEDDSNHKRKTKSITKTSFAFVIPDPHRIDCT